MVDNGSDWPKDENVVHRKGAIRTSPRAKLVEIVRLAWKCKKLKIEVLLAI
jgi:hypothetical protein